MRTIVVTGVSRGLGKAMAHGFLSAGCRVFGCARNSRAIGDLNDDASESSRFDVVDISSDDSVKAWAGQILESVGPPDFLVNNAALINANAPLWEVPAEEFNQLTAVNINGMANTVRHFVPAMVARGSGVVVNFSSGWGRSASANVAPYCATKWAVEGLTRALADELPSGMAAVPLNPGIIHTEMLESCFGGSAAMYPTPEQWAAQAVPFILQMSATDNGQPLTVPGM